MMKKDAMYEKWISGGLTWSPPLTIKLPKTAPTPACLPGIGVPGASFPLYSLSRPSSASRSSISLSCGLN